MKSILNRINVDTTKQPLFLGEGLSLQRYDRFRYEIFFKLFRKQIELIWTPEEISLDRDRADFQTLTDNEKFIFTSNLKFQTMLDSVVSRGVPTLLQYVSNPELEACLNVWQMFETLHSYSYTYIVKNVYSDPGRVLDSTLEDEEILKRAETVCRDYDLLASSKGDVKSQIYLTLISINILEAIRFYVSFVCAFAFAENKKMIGNADIIKLIKRDEAVHVSITQNIIKCLREQADEGFQETIRANESKALSMFEEAVAEEKAWATYLFANGSMLGLNEQILHQYIEWLADTRLVALGLPRVYNAKRNPIKGWSDAWFDSEKVQVAPQEHEITSYKISASENDIGKMDLTGFKL